MHDWPLWEIFLRTGNGAAYRHAGGLHAPDAALALQAARDVTRGAARG
jgi:ring-1,2-phenylacetyl-CoA epoxidase subunit PaaB